MSDAALPGKVPAVLEYRSAPPTAAVAHDMGDHAAAMHASIRRRAISSSAWTIAGFLAVLFVRVGCTLVLTRLLAPKDFGIISLAAMFIAGLQQFSDVGLGPALVQSKRGDDRRVLDTAWTISIIRGLGICLLGIVGAVPLARFYGQRDLAPVMVALSCISMVAAFNSTSIFTLNRHMQARQLTLLELGRQTMANTVAIAVAWFHPSAWAILAGGMSSTVAYLVATYFLIPGYRNRFCWDKEATRELFRFGGWIFISTVVTFFANDVDRLILGKLLTGTAALTVMGWYGQATMLARMPQDIVGRLASLSLFPALARSAELDPASLSAKLVRARQLMLSGGAAATVGLGLVAPVFVETLYDPRYWSVGRYAQVMAVGMWITLLQQSADRTLLAIGRPRFLAFSNAANMVFTILGAVGGYLLGQRIAIPGAGGDVWLSTYAIQGFILGVACGNLAGHVVVQVSLASHGIRLYRQDIRYTTLVATLVLIGLIVPRVVLRWAHVQHPKHWTLAFCLLLAASTSVWAMARSWRWVRAGRAPAASPAESSG